MFLLNTCRKDFVKQSLNFSLNDQKSRYRPCRIELISSNYIYSLGMTVLGYSSNSFAQRFTLKYIPW
jgi:hypothetical protein